MGKLVRLMKCPHATVNDTLTLDAGKGLHNVKWQVDSAFGVHPDFKSHVMGTMTFKGRKGSVINTESSMVAESVGVDCALPLALWVPQFLKEQGCNVKENIIEQDNKSTMSLANNGKASSGKQTCMINI